LKLNRCEILSTATIEGLEREIKHHHKMIAMHTKELKNHGRDSTKRELHHLQQQLEILKWNLKRLQRQATAE